MVSNTVYDAGPQGWLATATGRMGHMIGWTAERWNALGMTFRFATVTSVVLLFGMLLLGEWVAKRIEEGVVHSHAASATLHVANHVSRRVQELSTGSTLSNEARLGLDQLLETPFVGRAVVGFRIWKDDTIVYAERSDLIGHRHPPSRSRSRALEGEVVAAYRTATRASAELGVAPGERLLEIYAPVRQTGSDRVIGLVETYELAPSLKTDIDAARTGVWLLVGWFGLHILLIQTAFVHHSSRIISRQRRVLDERVAQLSRMLAENSTLRTAKEAGARVTQESERHLRKLGADLHDGPLQLLAMAVLRLGALPELMQQPDPASLAEAQEDVEVVRDCVTDTINELRIIAAGLALPDVESRPLAEVIASAARSHARRSGLPVQCDVVASLPDVPPAVKVCAYRLVQEGLSNSLRHAAGRGQTVTATGGTNGVEICILDAGPGFGATGEPGEGCGRGLSGLRDRIESLGGTLYLHNRPGGGAQLCAQLPIDMSHTTASIS